MSHRKAGTRRVDGVKMAGEIVGAKIVAWLGIGNRRESSEWDDDLESPFVPGSLPAPAQFSPLLDPQFLVQNSRTPAAPWTSPPQLDTSIVLWILRRNPLQFLTGALLNQPCCWCQVATSHHLAPFLLRSNRKGSARTRGTVLYGTAAALLCTIVFIYASWSLAGKRMKSGGRAVRRDASRQQADWSRTRGAIPLSNTVANLNSQVDQVDQLERQVAALGIGGGSRGTRTSRSRTAPFLDPADPVRQYVQYRRSKYGQSRGGSSGGGGGGSGGGGGGSSRSGTRLSASMQSYIEDAAPVTAGIEGWIDGDMQRSGRRGGRRGSEGLAADAPAAL